MNIIKEYNDINKGLLNLEKNIDGIEKIDIIDFWKIKCDIIVPAAMELQITKDIAINIDCRLIAEGANGPITFDADKILFKKNIEIIPDVLCNSGGVIVSYFEWLQNNSNEYWCIDIIEEKLKKILYNTCDRLFNIKSTVNVNNRIIAYKISIDTLWNYYKNKY
jgi:glutamate dehydrogenase